MIRIMTREPVAPLHRVLPGGSDRPHAWQAVQEYVCAARGANPAVDVQPSAGVWEERSRQVDTPLGEVSDVVDAFHNLYYHSLGWDNNSYLGYQTKQCPFDIQVYQELVFKLRPRFIIQTGIAGGSALLLATLLDLIGTDQDSVVIGIDVKVTAEARTLTHPRIRLIEGSSTSPVTVKAVESFLPDAGGMISLDSDHSAGHVMNELRIYQKYVNIGSYLVVEDTNINGHPVSPGIGPGPLEAVEAFLEGDRRFVRDDQVWRRNLFSFHQ